MGRGGKGLKRVRMGRGRQGGESVGKGKRWEREGEGRARGKALRRGGGG